MNISNVVGRPALLAWTEGKIAIAIEEKTEKELADKFIPLLKNMFKDKVSKLVRVITTRWIKDEFSRGSYSFVPGIRFVSLNLMLLQLVQAEMIGMH